MKNGLAQKCPELTHPVGIGTLWQQVNRGKIKTFTKQKEKSFSIHRLNLALLRCAWKSPKRDNQEASGYDAPNSPCGGPSLVPTSMLVAALKGESSNGVLVASALGITKHYATAPAIKVLKMAHLRTHDTNFPYKMKLTILHVWV